MIIPMNYGLPAFAQTVELNGRFYRMTFVYNGRAQKWLMSIGLNATPVVASIVLLTGRDLLAPYRWSADLPPGLLTVDDANGDGLDPTIDTLGVTHRLIYDPV